MKAKVGVVLIRRKPERFLTQAMLGSMMVILMALAATAAGEAQAAKRELSRDQARAVVMTFFKSQGYQTDTPGFDLEGERDAPASPEFLMFHAFYSTVGPFSDQGAYAVSRTTLARRMSIIAAWGTEGTRTTNSVVCYFSATSREPY